MEKHKNKALENDCLCPKCMFRFQCFTQERVFSDPIFQGLFEALMAQGKSKEEALDEVTREIKFRIITPISIPNAYPPVTIPYPTTAPNASPFPYNPLWTIRCNNVSFDSLGNDKYQVNYTMYDGKEVNWNADAGDFFRKF